MNEEQFRKMLDAIQDGLWYDLTQADDFEDAGEDAQEVLMSTVLRHIGTGVRGTPAEAWLKAWREGKPPLTQPLDEKDNSE